MEDKFFKKYLSEKQIAQLIKYSSTDDSIIKNTGDKTRFKDNKSFNKWAKIPREIYVLTNRQDDLLGIIWFKPEKLNDEFGITLAIRLYANARGKGLSEIFLRHAFDEFKTTKLYLENKSKKFWLETRKDNSTAIALYEKMGFKRFGVSKNSQRIIMTRP